ncbi:hypothetical protein UT300009_21320 [Paraclostridium bifermentans]
MKSKTNLTQISKELFIKECKEKGKGIRIDEKELKQFMQKNARYFREILKALTISNYEQYLKCEFNNKNSAYQFCKKDALFIEEILKNFTHKNMLNLRRGNLDKVPDRFITWIVEGMYSIFKNNNVPETVLKEVILNMSNRTNYPLRKRYSRVSNLGYHMEELANNIFKPKFVTYMSKNDNCAWLDALTKDMELFIKKWQDIYSYMKEIRIDELTNLSEVDYNRMSEEDHINALLDFELAEEYNKAFEDDKVLKKMHKNLDDAYKNKTGFDIDKIDYINETKKRIDIRYEELRKQIITNHYGNIKINLESNIRKNEDMSDLMDSIDLLEEAISDYNKSNKEVSMLELPSINIEDLKKEILFKQTLNRD